MTIIYQNKKKYTIIVFILLFVTFKYKIMVVIIRDDYGLWSMDNYEFIKYDTVINEHRQSCFSSLTMYLIPI